LKLGLLLSQNLNAVHGITLDGLSADEAKGLWLADA
jgi:hypothetical protein